MILAELHRIRAEPVLEAVPQPHLPLQVKGEGGRFLPEEIPEDLQPRRGVQLPAGRGKLGKVGHEVGADPGKVAPGFRNIPFGGGDGDEPVLNCTGSAGPFREQHFVVFFPEMVQPVLPHGEQQGLLKLRPVHPAAADGDLGGSAGVQGVQ